MFAELFTPEQLTILTQIILIDLVLAGDNAIIFNPASPNELALKMKMLLRNDSLNKISSNNSLLRTDDFFGWDEYARRLEVIYQKILSGIV